MIIGRHMRAYWNTHDDLYDRSYYVIIVIGFIVSFIAATMTVFEGLGALSYIVDYIGSFFILIIGIWSVRCNREYIGHIFLPLVLNCLIMPASFWACGGLNTGTILFFVVCLFTIGVLLTGPVMYIVYGVSILVQSIAIWTAYYYPEIISEKSLSTEKAYVLDFNFALLFTSLALLAITSMIFKAYRQERDKNHQLIERLRDLSEKDELTGLFNRRELFFILENIFNEDEKSDNYLRREEGSIAIFDIDDFKKLNDTYGHLFGDEVLKMAAKVIQDNMVIDNSEAAFRYGGEEFVCILNCSEKDIIAKRVDRIRQQISELTWKDHENLKVTISGGAVRCLEYQCFNDALKAADELLYKAKEGGKNQVIV